MANSKHLEILQNGVDAWNKWRNDNQKVQPDISSVSLKKQNLNNINFSRTNLSQCNLRGVFMRNANLQQTNLSNANLQSADLRSSNLRDADLRNVILKDARLQNTIFYNANLESANLTNAKLSNANFTHASLSKADLDKARLAETVFADTNLSNAVNLTNCIHSVNSRVDEATFSKSEHLPKRFLRGCGLSDEMITFYHSLKGKPSNFFSCFISHSSEDEAFANKLHRDLEQNDVSCWFAPEDLKIGDRIRSTIFHSIEKHDKLLLILSKNSIESQWVEYEVETTLERERRENITALFPIRLDNEVMETGSGWASLIRTTRNIGDFVEWDNPQKYDTAFQRLLRDLKS